MAIYSNSIPDLFEYNPVWMVLLGDATRVCYFLIATPQLIAAGLFLPLKDRLPSSKQ